MPEDKTQVTGKVAEIEGPQGKCEKCERILPIVNADKSQNFSIVGSHGNKYFVCNDCKAGFPKSGSGIVVGWGR